MKYLEMIIDVRLKELREKETKTIEKMKDLIIKGNFNFEDDYICEAKIYGEDVAIRINELEKLKKDLGLVETKGDDTNE